MVTDRILLFIPCYNCAPQIGEVIGRLDGPVAALLTEILVLDNGSRDGTVEAAIKAVQSHTGPLLQIARNRENYNLGGSHKSAFAYARDRGFTHVLVLHGDDQGDIDDILPVLRAGDHRSHDACLGARFMRESRLKGYSRFRTFGNWGFNLLITLISARRVHDLGSGLNIFAEAVFHDLDVNRYADDLRFNVFLLLDLIRKRRKIMFFPISWREEDQISNVRIVSQARRTLAIALDYSLRPKRFRTADHRDAPREHYAFDVLARFPDRD